MAAVGALVMKDPETILIGDNFFKKTGRKREAAELLCGRDVVDRREGLSGEGHW
jgi:hypothetical protein